MRITAGGGKEGGVEMDQQSVEEGKRGGGERKGNEVEEGERERAG